MTIVCRESPSSHRNVLQSSVNQSCAGPALFQGVDRVRLSRSDMVLEGLDSDESVSKMVWEHEAPCNFPFKYLKVFHAFHKTQGVQFLWNCCGPSCQKRTEALWIKLLFKTGYVAIPPMAVLESPGHIR